MINYENGSRSDRYLGAPYKSEHSPYVFLDGSFDPLKDGINCQTFAHLYLRDEFGVNLPRGMWSKEIFEDDGLFFRRVNQAEPLVRGDLLFVGKPRTKHIRLHVGVVHQVADLPEDTVIRHANKKDGMVSDWTLKEMLEYEEYPVVRGVRQLEPDLHRMHIQPYLNQ